jgi:hypothetical protein
MLLLELALLYFVIATGWLIYRRRWKQAAVTLVVVFAFAAFFYFSMNLEMVDGQLQWIQSEQ